MTIIFVILYMLIAMATAVLYTYCNGNSNIENAYAAFIIGLVWPLLLPIFIILILCNKDVKKVLENMKQ